MSCSVCTAKLVAATGTVRGDSGRIGAIYGKVTTAGTLVLRDGGASGRVVLEQALATGAAQVNVPGALQFKEDVHATFADSLAGSLTLYFT